MDDPPSHTPSFADWITRPQMLVALSAVLLSLCGLFIAIYEAWSFRQAQRASVWPHVEVAASLQADEITIWVENTGIGPGRIRAAALSHEGETLDGWAELVDRLDVERASGLYRSFIGGRVLPPGAPETIFSVTASGDSARAELIPPLREAILTGSVDLVVCYCSVYDECWTAAMSDLVERFRGDPPSGGSREVDDCEEAPSSRI